jgi:hypothetical protein
MMAQGFKPVGWVAGVAAAALGCYMLSLNVASERAELAKLEMRIITAKRQIRSLQAELGTRGRLQQLESWNAEVLALSAPTSNQFVDNTLTLARFDSSEKTVAERAPVQMASVDSGRAAPVQAQQPQIAAPVRYASAPAAEAAEQRPLVHQASFVIPQAKPQPEARPGAQQSKPVAAEAKVEARKPVAEAKKKPSVETKKLASAKRPLLIDDKLTRDIRAAAKAEAEGGSGTQ